MTAATLVPTRSVTVPALSTTSAVRLRAAVLSIAGWVVAFGIMALSLLVMPVSALVVFGPALLSAL